jgi:hypothetical protein
MQTISLTSFAFSVEGFYLCYLYKHDTIRAFYDAKATAQLFQDAGFIEGFDLDKNGEPVILYTDETRPQGYNGAQWSDFLKTFPMQKRIAEMLAEYREERKHFKLLQNLVNCGRYQHRHPTQEATA